MDFDPGGIAVEWPRCDPSGVGANAHANRGFSLRFNPRLPAATPAGVNAQGNPSAPLGARTSMTRTPGLFMADPFLIHNTWQLHGCVSSQGFNNNKLPSRVAT